MALLDDIKQTIKYASKFGGEITLEQLYTRLLSDKRYSKEEISKIVTSCQLRVTSKQNDKENNKKIILAKELVLNHLSKFNNILMVAVTGSVAAQNAKKSEDIDLFLICKGNTMWITRLMVRLYIRINNIPHRKFGYEQKPNDFCFNLWMDENNMTVPLLKQNQKNAVDTVMMKVLLNRNKTYEKFMIKNVWVEKYVANGYKQLRVNSFKLRVLEYKTGIIVKSLNYLAYILQIVYIRLKGPIKFINLYQAFFHK